MSLCLTQIFVCVEIPCSILSTVACPFPGTESLNKNVTTHLNTYTISKKENIT